jgi:hypothetical protein
MAKRRLKNLNFRVEILGLVIDLTPFRWARFAFKTQWTFLGRKQSTQLFAGPLHIWTFAREGKLTLSFEVGLTGSVHGTFTPTGDNAIPYFWKKLTGIGWAEMPRKRFDDLIADGNSEDTARAFIEGEFGVTIEDGMTA